MVQLGRTRLLSLVKGVVSVLISVTTVMFPTGNLLVTSIFLGDVGS